MFSVEELAEKLHEFYLEAVKEIDNKFYEPKIKGPYSELLGVQKEIYHHIAKKLLDLREIPISNIPTSLDEVYKEIMIHIKELHFPVLEWTFRIPFKDENHPWQDITITHRGLVK